MKFLNLTLLVALALAALPSQAALRNSPFPPYIDQRFSDLEDDTLEGAAIARKQASFVYDVAVDGGSSVSHDLGVTIPAGAVITALRVYVNTAFTDSGTGSVALQCYGTNDLMDWQDLTLAAKDSMLVRQAGPLLYALQLFGTGGSVINTGAQFTPVNSGASVPTACSIKAIVRSSAIGGGQTSGGVPQLTGKIKGVVDYFTR